MEVRLGIDALNWQGRSLFRDLSELRKFVTTNCVGNYSDEFRFLDFVLHLGEIKKSDKNVRINRRAFSIACHLFFDGGPELTQSELRNGVADALILGANELVATLQRSAIQFQFDTFSHDIDTIVTGLRAEPWDH